MDKGAGGCGVESGGRQTEKRQGLGHPAASSLLSTSLLSAERLSRSLGPLPQFSWARERSLLAEAMSVEGRQLSGVQGTYGKSCYMGSSLPALDRGSGPVSQTSHHWRIRSAKLRPPAPLTHFLCV